MSKTRKVNHSTAPATIIDRVDFANSTGNLSGRWHQTGASITRGRLNSYESSRLDEDSEHAPLYVVYSFLTPIAWWTERRGWYKVKQRFSPITSSKHQSRLYLIP